MNTEDSNILKKALTAFSRAILKGQKDTQDATVGIFEKHMRPIAEKLNDAIELIKVTKEPVEQKEFPTSIEVSNLPSTQKVEVTNFPKQEAPIVNVEAPKAPIVHVAPAVVNMDTESMVSELVKINETLSKPEVKEIEDTRIIDEDGEVVSFKKLFGHLIDRVSVGRQGPASVVIPDNLGVTITGSTPQAIQIDDVSTSGVTYIGKAALGAGTGASVWQIQKIDESGSPVTTTIKWAGGGSFNQVWDNRTSLTYA